MHPAITALFVSLLLLGGFTHAAAQEQSYSTTSSAGLRLSMVPSLQPLQINQIHSWELTVTDANGNPVSDAQISVLGGMPEHDHGMPTQPAIVAGAAPGRYLMQGMRFHMPGLWRLEFAIEAAAGPDRALFEFSL